jgi:serine/threonine protein kinase
VDKPPPPGVSDEGLGFSEHLILGVLAMHRANVTHNDLHAHNLLIDCKNVARWCDFDNAVVERGDCDVIVCDSLPPDARLYTALMDSPLHVFLYRMWVRDRATHIRRDWTWLADLLASTWSPLPMGDDDRSRRWAHAIQSLRVGDDQAARLAFTLVRAARATPHIQSSASKEQSSNQ